MKKRTKTVEQSLLEMNSIALENLKNPVHREFINDTLREAVTTEAITENLGRQLVALQAAYHEELQASLIFEATESLAEQVNRLAGERTKAQTALKSGFRAMMGVANAEVVAVATLLFELMHRYDLHAGMDVDAQTGVCDSFFTAVDEKYSAELRLSGMTELYNLFRQKNIEVCNKVAERDKADIDKVTGRMEMARKVSDAAFRELRRAVNAFAYVYGPEDYATFIGYMNALILRYKREHLHQSASTPSASPSQPTTPGEEEDTTPEETTPPGETPDTNPDTNPGEQTPTEGTDYTFVDGILTWLRESKPMNFTLFPPGTKAPATECAIPENATKVKFIHFDQTESFAWYERNKTIVAQGNLPENEDGCIWSGIYSKLTGSTHTAEEVEE